MLLIVAIAAVIRYRSVQVNTCTEPEQMPLYAIKVGEMRVTSDKPIPSELRAAVLKAVREALRGMDGDLGYEGYRLEFVPER